MSLGQILSPIIVQDSPEQGQQPVPSAPPAQHSVVAEPSPPNASSIPSAGPSMVDSAKPTPSGPAEPVPSSSANDLNSPSAPKESIHPVPGKPPPPAPDGTDNARNRPHHTTVMSSGTPVVAVGTSLDGKVYTYTSTSYQVFTTTLPESTNTSDGSAKGSSAASVVGGVIGVLVLAGVIAFFCVMRRRRNRKQRAADADQLIYYRSPSSAATATPNSEPMSDANYAHDRSAKAMPVGGHSPMMESGPRSLVAPMHYAEEVSTPAYMQAAPYHPTSGYYYDNNYPVQSYYSSDPQTGPGATYSSADLYRTPSFPHRNVPHEHMDYSNYNYPHDTYYTPMRTDVPHSRD